jgi:hypothetical protein
MWLKTNGRTNMTDEEVMGQILKTLHEKHHQDLVPLTAALSVLGVPQNVLRSNLSRMRQRGLIDWLDQEIGGLGMGHITDYGINVAENKVPPPMPMVIHYTNVTQSSHVQVGQGNVQGVTIDLDVGKLVAAIDNSKATLDEKAEAKSLLKRIVENPLVKSALEKWVKGMIGTP